MQEPAIKQDRRGAPRGDQSKPKGRRREGTKHEGRMGNLPFEPTDAQRELVRTFGSLLTNEQLALKLGISSDTLSLHMKDELAAARVDAVALVAGKLFQQAMKGDRTSQIFFLKTKGGWTQRQQIEVEGQASIKLNLGNLTDDQIRAAIPVFEALAAAAGDSGGDSGESQ